LASWSAVARLKTSRTIRRPSGGLAGSALRTRRFSANGRRRCRKDAELAASSEFRGSWRAKPAGRPRVVGEGQHGAGHAPRRSSTGGAPGRGRCCPERVQGAGIVRSRITGQGGAALLAFAGWCRSGCCWGHHPRPDQLREERFSPPALCTAGRAGTEVSWMCLSKWKKVARAG